MSELRVVITDYTFPDLAAERAAARTAGAQFIPNSKLQQLVADDIRRALASQPPRCPVPLP